MRKPLMLVRRLVLLLSLCFIAMDTYGKQDLKLGLLSGVVLSRRVETGIWSVRIAFVKDRAGVSLDMGRLLTEAEKIIREKLAITVHLVLMEETEIAPFMLRGKAIQKSVFGSFGAAVKVTDPESFMEENPQVSLWALFHGESASPVSSPEGKKKKEKEIIAQYFTALGKRKQLPHMSEFVRAMEASLYKADFFITNGTLLADLPHYADPILVDRGVVGMNGLPLLSLGAIVESARHKHDKMLSQLIACAIGRFFFPIIKYLNEKEGEGCLCGGGLHYQKLFLSSQKKAFCRKDREDLLRGILRDYGWYYEEHGEEKKAFSYYELLSLVDPLDATLQMARYFFKKNRIDKAIEILNSRLSIVKKLKETDKETYAFELPILQRYRTTYLKKQTRQKNGSN